MHENEKLVRAYFAAVHAKDIDLMLSMLHDDFEYRNMPYDRRMTSKADKRKFFEWFTKGMTDYKLELHNIAAVGNIVFHEGVENYTKKGHRVALPYAGIFEFRDGKITRQRDYFDARTIEKQLGMLTDEPVKKQA